MKKFVSLTLASLFLLVFSEVKAPLFGEVAAVTGVVANTPTRITMSYYDGTANSRGFNWVTNTTITSSALSIIKKTGAMSKATVDWTGATTVNATSNDFHALHRSWKAHVLDLDYNQTYYYRLLANGIPTETFEFYVTDGQQSYTLMHFSDAQGYSYNDYTNFTNTMQVAANQIGWPDAFITTGDLTQSNTNSDSNVKEWGYAINAIKDQLVSLPLTIASGNHDKAPNMLVNHFNVKVPTGSATSTGIYYSYDISDIHVAVINTNDELTTSVPLAQAQIDWLIDDLSNSTATWKILNMHKGLYTTGRHYRESDINLLRNQLFPIISTYGVDLVIQGHDHVYARSNPHLFNSDGKTANPSFDTITKTRGNYTYDYAVDAGTYYVIPNTVSAHKSNLSPNADNSDLPTYYNLATSKINGLYLNQQPYTPMFGYITFEDDTMLYEAYQVNSNNKAVLYDYFGTVKTTAKQAEKLIDALPATYSSAIKYDLAKAVSYFDNLKPEELAKVNSEAITKIQSLTAYTNVNAYRGSREVVQLISVLEPAVLTPQYLAKLDNIRTKYEALSNITKTFVENYSKYTTLRSDYDNRQAAFAVDTQILQLSSASTTEEVRTVRAAYDLLTNAQKYYVKHYFVLLQYEQPQDHIHSQYSEAL